MLDYQAMDALNFFDSMKGILVQWVLLVTAWVLLSRWIGSLCAWLIEVKQIPFWEERLFSFLKIDTELSMTWQTYAWGLFRINLLTGIWLLGLLKLQNYLPGMTIPLQELTWSEAVNLVVSFMTQTNWQTFALQERVAVPVICIGILLFQFLAPATAIAVAFAWIRSFLPEGRLGNCSVDLLRVIFYVLLPGSILFALVLLSQGGLQNFLSSLPFVPLEGDPNGVLPQGPMVALESIALLGNNGGGLLSANFSHPYANPTAWTHWLGACLLGAIPGSLLYAFGKVLGVRAKGHARLLWILSFGLLFLAGIGLTLFRNPNFLYEGRLGIAGSEFFATISVATGTGANSADFSTLAAGGQWVLLLLMHVGQLIFGGGGVGFCNTLFLVIFGVFLGGLMLGKTPQYFGKKIELPEIIWMAIGLMGAPLLVLIGLGLITFFETHTGDPKSFTDLLYALSSCVYNNGSNLGFANAAPIYQWVLALLMFLGRMAALLPALVLAGRFAIKTTSPQSPNDLPLSGLWFGLLYLILMMISTALVYAPTWFLGPFSI